VAVPALPSSTAGLGHVLLVVWRKAARGKRGTASAARFEYCAEERLAEVRA
jgi:hypothetical protein